MANIAKNAILRAKIEGILTDIMVKTTASQVYMDDTTTLASYVATLAAKADLEALQQTVNALGALAQKDKVSQADLDEALATLIGSKAAQADLEALAGRVTTVEGQVTTLVGEDAGKSARTIANEELAKQLIGENAKESLDTLEEIAKWIQDHPDDASAMNAAITALQQQMVGIDAGEGTVKKYVDDAITALKIGDYAKAADLTALAGRVTTAEGEIDALQETVNGLGAMATLDEVAEENLNAALKEKVNAAAEGNHSHANKAELDKIVEGDKAKWDAAEQNAKDYADGLNEAMDGRMQAVEGKAHEHANKDVLDGISAENVTAWNGKANVYFSAEEPANLTENDLWFALVD